MGKVIDDHDDGDSDGGDIGTTCSFSLAFKVHSVLALNRLTVDFKMTTYLLLQVVP